MMKIILPANMLVWSFLLAVMAVKGEGNVLRDSLETNLFTASIECSPSYQTTDDVECEFHLTNNGDDKYSVLKWNLPLHKMEPEGLVVKRDGKKLDYNGPMMKREAPDVDAFQIIGAGETHSCKFDLSPGYDTSKPGTYTVTVNAYLEYVKGSVSSSKKTGRETLVHLTSPAESFKVVG